MQWHATGPNCGKFITGIMCASGMEPRTTRSHVATLVSAPTESAFTGVTRQMGATNWKKGVRTSDPKDENALGKL